MTHVLRRSFAGLCVLALLAPPTALASVAPPVAYWSFDNEPGFQINDSSHNGNVGTLFNGPAFSADVPTQIGGGQSLSFSDPGDARTNMQYAALDMSFSSAGQIPQFTAAGWFKTSFSGPPTGSVQQNNWSFLDFDRNEFFNVYVRDTDGATGFSTGVNSATSDMVSGTTGLHDGAWHHFAVVYDGTDKRIYVDGAPDGTDANPHGGAALGSNITRYGFIGDGSEADEFNGTKNNLFYDGRVDDIAYWDTVLSDADIAALASGAASPGDEVGPAPRLELGPHVVDFESLAGVPEGSLVGDRIAGMHFDGAMIAFEGTSPRFAHTALGIDDGVAPGEPAGGVMISDIANIQLNPNDPVAPTPANPILITWNGAKVMDLTFRAIDIDGGHELTAMVFDRTDGGNLLDMLTITAGDPGTGDGIATLVSFPGISGIARLEVFVVNNNSTLPNSGFALDTFTFTVHVPEPATAMLLGLGGLALVGRRRKR